MPTQTTTTGCSACPPGPVAGVEVEAESILLNTRYSTGKLELLVLIRDSGRKDRDIKVEIRWRMAGLVGLFLGPRAWKSLGSRPCSGQLRTWRASRKVAPLMQWEPAQCPRPGRLQHALFIHLFPASRRLASRTSCCINKPQRSVQASCRSERGSERLQRFLFIAFDGARRLNHRPDRASRSHVIPPRDKASPVWTVPPPRFSSVEK
jgi:hypothetical protein